MALKSKAIQKVEPDLSDMSVVPDFIAKEALGTEAIGIKDVRLPRLKLVQAQSPEVVKGESIYNENLRAGDLINDLTQEKFSDEAVTIVVLKCNPPRFVEYDENGKDIIDASVPADDPRTQWRVDHKTKKLLPPVATMFYDYLVGICPELEPLMFSFKSTGINDAKRLNGLIKAKKTPIWSCYYKLEVVQKKNDEGTWYGLSVTQAGWVTPEDYTKGESWHTMYKEKAVDFTEEPKKEEPSEM